MKNWEKSVMLRWLANLNPANLKKVFSVRNLKAGLLSLFTVGTVTTSCDKTKPEVDPNAEINARIAALVTDSTNNANAMKAAVQPALTEPENVSDLYWRKFDGLGLPKGNLPDSANLHLKTIDALRGIYGNPTPFNAPNLAILYTNAGAYLVTVDALAAERRKLTK